MTAPVDVDPVSASGYIRGGAGLSVEPRRILRIGIGAIAVALLVVIVALTVEAARHNARDHRLTEHGVAVTATVTSCLGTATGTGITVNGFTCRGTVTLNGHQHTDILRGVTGLKQRGDLVRGVTDRNDPNIFSTTGVVASANPSWRAYLVPGVLTAVLILGVGVAAVGVRRIPRRARDRPAATPAGDGLPAAATPAVESRPDPAEAVGLHRAEPPYLPLVVGAGVLIVGILVFGIIRSKSRRDP